MKTFKTFLTEANNESSVYCNVQLTLSNSTGVQRQEVLRDWFEEQEGVGRFSISPDGRNPYQYRCGFWIKSGGKLDLTYLTNRFYTAMNSRPDKVQCHLLFTGVELKLPLIFEHFSDLANQDCHVYITPTQEHGDLTGIHEKIDVRYLEIAFPSYITGGATDLLKVPNLETIRSKSPWLDIVKKYLEKDVADPRVISECQEELFNAGFKDVI